ncbi:P1 family peptidase [Candidatus Poribacteria bacterium]|nr:P1 family peptidase [Candidatus Poribacteria bacterium]
MRDKSEPMTNDNTQLVPQTSFDGPVLEFDFPSLLIGVAEYKEGPTGCTVFYFPKGGSAVVDIRGGSPGVIEADYGWYDAICFAGGSLYGLEAAIGVRAELLAIRGYKVNWRNIPLVSGAIIWDWGGRGNAIYPDKDLGRAALKSARSGTFPLGARGAGRSATVGKSFAFAAQTSGQGGAFRQVGPTKIAVFTVVNAMGVIVNRQGEVVRGNLDPKTGERHHYRELLERKLAQNEKTDPPEAGKHTTLTLVVTNQKLDLRQLARQVHSSMARAIQPFHTESDGDVLYAVTTNEVENKALNPTNVGVLASELAWDAVLSSF